MNGYEKKLPIVFQHIPKMAGASVRVILKEWYREDFIVHSFFKERANYKPEPVTLYPGACLCGHFNRSANYSVLETLYPDVQQVFTFIRHPFEAALSRYFFWKMKRRRMLIDAGKLKENDFYDYTNLSDFLIKQPKSLLLKFLPEYINQNNYKEVLEEYLFFIGIVDYMQLSVDLLALKLGFESVRVKTLNKSVSNEDVPPNAEDIFRENNVLAYLIYEHVKKQYDVLVRENTLI